MSGENPHHQIVNESQLFGWRHRVQQIEEEIRSLGAEKEKLVSLISMAERLSDEARRLAAARGDDSSSGKFINEALSELEEKDAFPKAVMAIVERAADGATYDDIREAILLSPLSKRFRKSDKGFYHALRRLKNADALVDYRGYVFTPENLRSYLRKVEAGIKPDKDTTRSMSRATKMTNMILEVVAASPGLVAKEVIGELCKRDAEIAERLEGNDGSAYNAIARFKKRGEIEGFGHLERQLRIGPNASEEFKRLAKSGVVIPLAKRTEAPSGRTAGASDGPLFGTTPRS
ncbi:hypothetical protein [Sphingopyxis sp. MC1]|uniref:hypothetical protein n=1 Tax=Sphingopyxis sp. MC1 TaxID=1174684 RepID=UPI0002D20B2B|nr:hypothetical protein [Sphingopyxis sp. MC1]ENY79850.1 hypothetical protein EBMC1_17102 [Sphingopyxis sp. MC1]